jgi:hypothetical protein
MPRNIKSRRLNIRISEATISQLDWLIQDAGFTNRTQVIERAIDRMYNLDRSSMSHKRPIIVAAQLIGGYVGPEWLVEPVGEPSDDDDLAAINSAAEVYVMDTDIRGWGEYNAIIRVANESVPALGSYYLARLA